MTIKEKMLKIMSLALEINPPEVEDVGLERTAIFVNWVPSCNGMIIKVSYGGWKRSIEPDENFTVYTDMEGASESLDAVIKKLEKIKEELNE